MAPGRAEGPDKGGNISGSSRCDALGIGCIGLRDYPGDQISVLGAASAPIFTLMPEGRHQARQTNAREKCPEFLWSKFETEAVILIRNEESCQRRDKQREHRWSIEFHSSGNRDLVNHLVNDQK